MQIDADELNTIYMYREGQHDHEGRDEQDGEVPVALRNVPEGHQRLIQLAEYGEAQQRSVQLVHDQR